MSIIITDECLNCGACEPECPNNAIYEGGEEWKYSDGTNLKGFEPNLNGEMINMDKKNNPIQDEYYYIVEDKCTECISYENEPQCVAVCPVNCCVPSKKETPEELNRKVEWMFKGDTSTYDEMQKKAEEWRKNFKSPCSCHSSENDSINIQTTEKSNNFWDKIINFFK